MQYCAIHDVFMLCEGYENKSSAMVSGHPSDWLGCESDVSWSHHVLQTIRCQVCSSWLIRM